MTTLTAEPAAAPRRARRGQTTYKLVVLPGDGIGPEVVAEGLRVLRAVGERFDCRFDCDEHVLGGACIDAHGVALRPETLAAARKSHALKVRLAQLGHQITQEELNETFVHFKELADHKREISDEDLEEILVKTHAGAMRAISHVYR